jgi:IS5 family transposase
MHNKCVNWVQIHAFKMIKYTDQNSVKNQLFTTPFQKQLDPNNRWVRMADIIAWDKLARVYMQYMSIQMGRSTVDLRTVMGAMFIQHSLNLTDRKTIEMISENVYMQYFVGLSTFQTAAIFDHSLLSVFRQRLGKQGGEELNKITVGHAFETGQINHRKSRRSTKEEDRQENNKEHNDEIDNNKEGEKQEVKEKPTENRGTVKIDATVVPQNITYPTDAKLLNHSREISEAIIDDLYEQLREAIATKPRTYRREARQSWLGFSKSRKPNRKTVRKQLKRQLSYLKRNLNHIDSMLQLILGSGELIVLKEGLRKKLYVISEIYRQQQEMYGDNRKRISDRIVNVSQPWVRPIIRGKAGRAVEFGAKINLSLTEQLAIVDESSFDAFNESLGLVAQLESYKELFGYYPQYALVDKIYLTRNNRKYMKDKGIRHTGSPLGRPAPISKEVKAKMKKKNNERNHVEGKFGQGKQKFGLDNLRTKTKGSSFCAINLIVMAMNMLALLKKDPLAIFDDILSITKEYIQHMFSIYWTILRLITLDSIYPTPTSRIY